LTQEVQQAKDDTLAFYVEQFEGLSDREIVAMFYQARQQDYLEIDTQAAELEQKINTQPKIAASEIKEAIAKLKNATAKF
jgi:hypothetical protein